MFLPPLSQSHCNPPASFMSFQDFLIKQLTLNRDASLSPTPPCLTLCFSLGFPLSEETTQGHKLVASSDNPLSACHSHTHAQKLTGTDPLTISYYPNTHTHARTHTRTSGCDRIKIKSGQSMYRCVYVCVLVSIKLLIIRMHRQGQTQLSHTLTHTEL